MASIVSPIIGLGWSRVAFPFLVIACVADVALDVTRLGEPMSKLNGAVENVGGILAMFWLVAATFTVALNSMARYAAIVAVLLMVAVYVDVDKITSDTTYYYSGYVLLFDVLWFLGLLYIGLVNDQPEFQLE